MAEKKTAPITTVKSEVDTMIDALVEKAQVALHKFLELDQEQVDHIVHDMAGLLVPARRGAACISGDLLLR